MGSVQSEASEVEFIENSLFLRASVKRKRALLSAQSAATPHPEQYLRTGGSFVALTFLPRLHNVNDETLKKFHIWAY
jgi:hypothetical protein